MKIKLIKKVINIVLILITCFCLIKIACKINDYYISYKNYKELQVLSPDSKSDSSSATTTEKIALKEKEYDLRNINKDYKFWIKVDGTEINYPVVQGTDNNFYLNRSFYGKKNSSGCVFLDYRNDFDIDKNLIVYGHNMKVNTMFAQLNKFKDKTFFENNKCITLYKNTNEITYEIFSVNIIDAKKLELTPNLKSNTEYLDYLNKEGVTSIFRRDSSLKDSDRILTLVTCSSEFDDARLILIAKELND